MAHTLGIVVSQFNSHITSRMRAKAEAQAKSHDAKTIIVEVPGSFDIPFAAKKLLDNGVDAVAALGAAIKGETDHDDVIVRVAADRLAALSLEYKRPVSLGIIGPNATAKQAEERAEEYAERAVDTALDLLNI